MNPSFSVQGWCPTAWQPMQAQDGWLVRVRPPCAAITAAQWRVLAELAIAHGDSQLELTRLGNVQLRGVAEAGLGSLRAALVAAGLAPAQADADLAPPVHCTPFYRPGDATHALALQLSAAVQQQLSPAALQRLGLAPLPSKFGLLVDDGPQRLKHTGADIRLWLEAGGRYALCASGALEWLPFEQAEDAVSTAMQLARWFAQQRTQHQPAPTRLRSLIAHYPRNTQIHREVAAAASALAKPVSLPADGVLIGAPLGRINAHAMLAALQHLPESAPLRVTPWRSLWVDVALGPAFQDPQYWITEADDVRLRVSACTGAPRCAQAHIPAQALAMELAPHVPAGSHLHVSGCAKRCALAADATAEISAALQGASVQLFLRSNSPHAAPPLCMTPDALRAAPQQIQQLIHDLHA